ncbi:hypothetical protein QMK19_29055 [Streptomyces sp. H10-C2]|uniref:hypothetical protein n=1 Tax=unclassified Streptomyces TaxID=2593676 RepID=UPI0024B97BF6|nr:MULTISPECIES: hypothetical protein [unclassified Streptomyces]MDJ0344260.1 hypothetical protein [Streptomyces sp. PH10-H1]MDJ0373598.1 hypothetical protein [Streptomyces sp. H10-C2]
MATAALTPTEIIRAAAAVTRARGYYQPLTRQWEPAVPTAMDVERWLFAQDPIERGDRQRFAAQCEAAAAETPAVLAWCAEGERGNAYRTTLARIARMERASTRDIPVLCSAVDAYRRTQQRAAMAAERTASAEHSRHQCAQGERLTLTVTVAVVVDQGSSRFGYSEQPRLLVKFRDADHHIYVWEAKTKNVPDKGARVQVTGTVASHGQYQGTRQTNLIRCRWTPAKD